MNTFYDIDYEKISNADLQKALESLTFIRNTSMRKELRKHLSIAISCMEKCQEEKR